MPTLTRRELDAPGPVLTMVGGYDAVNFGYTGYSLPHLLGPPGPRGGRRTICGRPWQRHWIDRDLEFPLPGPDDYRSYYMLRRWRAVCPECKAGLSAAV